MSLFPVSSFSLSPRRLSIYNSWFREVESSNSGVKVVKNTPDVSRLQNIYKTGFSSSVRFHNFQISETARKRMINKISWLYHMAKSKDVTTLKGKRLTNFKINFITLTLPAAQMHPTKELNNLLLNQFFTEIQVKYPLKNYVWRLEFQGNGNVHYHIVTDVYIDYFIVKKIWNRLLSKLGYIDLYAEKHISMSLNDYVNAYSRGGSVDFDILKKRYIEGKAFKWRNPNSVDVKSVTSGKKIMFYISKYFSKKNKTNVSHNTLDTPENSTGLRLWFCSRSLSKLDKVTGFVEATYQDLLSAVQSSSDVFKVSHDFCDTWFFSFSSLCNFSKKIINKFLCDYAISLNYSPG